MVGWPTLHQRTFGRPDQWTGLPGGCLVPPQDSEETQDSSDQAVAGGWSDSRLVWPELGLGVVAEEGTGWAAGLDVKADDAGSCGWWTVVEAATDGIRS